MYYGMFYDPTMILLIPAILLTMYAQSKVKKKFRIYSNVSNKKHISGVMAARRILDSHGLSNVPIEMVSGKLTDHYDPRSRTMRLSSDVFNGTSIAAISIAAHESGHALQHQESYKLLMFRNVIAKPVSLVSNISWVLIFAGIVISSMGNVVGGNTVFDIGILCFVAVVLFHLVTLPVELNASSRAIKELSAENLVYEDETSMAKEVLSAAALTYVAALATAVLNLVRLLLIRGRD